MVLGKELATVIGFRCTGFSCALRLDSVFGISPALWSKASRLTLSYFATNQSSLVGIINNHLAKQKRKITNTMSDPEPKVCFSAIYRPCSLDWFLYNLQPRIILSVKKGPTFSLEKISF